MRQKHAVASKFSDEKRNVLKRGLEDAVSWLTQKSSSSLLTCFPKVDS